MKLTLALKLFVKNYTEFHTNATINRHYYVKDDRRRLYKRNFFKFVENA